MKSLAALILFTVGLTELNAQTKTWQALYFQDNAPPPFLLGTPTIWNPPSATPPSWTGYLTSVQTSSYLVLGYARDDAGNSYTLYGQGSSVNTSIPLGYVSKTISGVTQYFAINGIAPSMLGVSPSGDVFFVGNDESVSRVTLFQIGSNGVLSTVFQFSGTFFDVGDGIPGPITVDQNDSISIAAATPAGSGTFSPATYLFITTGPVPNAVPLASAFTTGTSIVTQVTSTLPITYQWSLNAAPIPGATKSSYTPTDQGVYTVTASTTAGTVSLNTTAFSPPVAPVIPPGQLVNISTRAFVGTGSSIAIGGFVITGSANEQVLVRAVGPTLSQFSVSGVLAQPVLSVFNSSGTQIATNTGWGTNSNSAQISSTFTTTGAFVLPAGSADSALLLSLAPGAYTVQVSGLNNTTGNALVEVYEVPTTQ